MAKHSILDHWGPGRRCHPWSSSATQYRTVPNGTMVPPDRVIQRDHSRVKGQREYSHVYEDSKHVCYNPWLRIPQESQSTAFCTFIKHSKGKPQEIKWTVEQIQDSDNTFIVLSQTKQRHCYTIQFDLIWSDMNVFVLFTTGLWKSLKNPWWKQMSKQRSKWIHWGKTFTSNNFGDFALWNSSSFSYRQSSCLALVTEQINHVLI